MRRNLNISLLIIVVSGLFFIPFIGRLHLFDLDEINFAESAREMLLTKDFLTVRIFFEPFWEKPPLFIWLQVLSMKMFGVNEFAARFPNAVCGIVTLLLLFNLGRKLVDEKFGLIWTLCFGVSLLPFLYFKSGIIDPWFNLFIFSGVTAYYYSQQNTSSQGKILYIIYSALFIGLAVLTKGPVAILVFGLTVFLLLIFDKFKLNLKFSHILIFAFVLIVTGGFWYVLQILNGNWQLVVDFFVYQIQLFRGQNVYQNGFPFYHFIIVFFGVFPASVFAIQAHRKNASYSDYINGYRKIMLILFWVVLILFSIVKTKIVHYSSLIYFPLTFLAAYSVYSFIKKENRIPLWIKILQTILIIFISLVVITFPIFDKHNQWLIEKGYITHLFTIGNLQATSGWSLWICLIGVLLLSGGLIAVLFLWDKKKLAGFVLLAITSLLFVSLTIIFITPGVEKYSQNAEIKFYKELIGKDVYSHSFFKSYAMLFYTNAKPTGNPNAFDIDWLASGDIDKDAWFVIRADKKVEILKLYPKLEVIYEKNGYVFCIRHKVYTKINDKSYIKIESQEE